MEVARYLHDKDPELGLQTTNNGRTPLHTAALHGHHEVVAFLISLPGIDVNKPDCCGITPLMDAASKGCVAIVDDLLSAGADPALVDKLGKRAIHFAAMTGNAEALLVLAKASSLTYDANPASAPDVFEGFTPAHYAAREGHLSVIQALETLAADFSVKDTHGRTPSDVAEMRAFTDIVVYLASSNVQP